MDPTLQALTPVLDDLRRSSGFQFIVEQSAGRTVYLLQPDGAGIGVLFDPDFDADDNAVRFAQSVQEYAIEVGGGAWPTCPSHPDSNPLWLSDDGGMPARSLATCTPNSAASASSALTTAQIAAARGMKPGMTAADHGNHRGCSRRNRN